jgi:hypothetical protein
MDNKYFIHVPKTGGLSIREFIKKTDNFFVLLDRPSDSKRPDPAEKVRFFSDLKSEQDNGFTFSVVRNPFDRLVSLYFYAKKISPIFKKVESFHRFVWDYALNFDVYKNDLYFKVGDPKWFESVENIEHHASGMMHPKFHLNEVDHFIRFENFQEDFNVLCDKLHLPRTQLPHKNKTNHEHYSKYYTPCLAYLVYGLYKKDFEFFGYKGEL